MEKRIYNEQTGIGYTLQSDYYLPNLALPEQEDKPIGYRDSDTCGISSNTTRCDTQIC